MVVRCRLAKAISTGRWVSAHVFRPLVGLLTVVEGICKGVHTGALFVMLNLVGDSSSHVFARTNISLDEPREGKRGEKRRRRILCMSSMVGHVLWTYGHTFHLVPPHTSHDDILFIFIGTKRSAYNTKLRASTKPST